MKKITVCWADEVIAKAIEIYNKEGGKEGTFELLDYESSHAYCVKAEQILSNPPKEERR